MSTMSRLATDLAELQDLALQDAAILAHRLQEIADLHWQGLPDAPLFMVTPEVIDTLLEIQKMLVAPISEIESAAF